MIIIFLILECYHVKCFLFPCYHTKSAMSLPRWIVYSWSLCYFHCQVRGQINLNNNYLNYFLFLIKFLPSIVSHLEGRQLLAKTRFKKIMNPTGFFLFQAVNVTIQIATKKQPKVRVLN